MKPALFSICLLVAVFLICATIKLPSSYEVSDAEMAKITILDRNYQDAWPNQKFRIGEGFFGNPSNQYQITVQNKEDLKRIEEAIGTIWQSPFAGNSHEGGNFYCLIELEFADNFERKTIIQFTDTEWERPGGETPDLLIQLIRKKFS